MSDEGLMDKNPILFICYSLSPPLPLITQNLHIYNLTWNRSVLIEP